MPELFNYTTYLSKSTFNRGAGFGIFVRNK